VRNNLSFINIYKKKNLKSEVVSQLLYGDTFKIIKKENRWSKIKVIYDKYQGYIENKKFSSNENNTHKVCKKFAHLYLKPNSKNKIKKKISFSSRVKVIEKKGSFYKFDNTWIKKNSLKKNIFKVKDNFYYVKKFINVKYKWGGKHFTGIDCSGLLQIFLSFNNKFCPRDTKDQIKFFKKKVELKNIKEKDLIFWKGHIAIVISKTKLIHAYGPMKKTIVMPIKETIDRIYKTANLKVIGIRRMI